MDSPKISKNVRVEIWRGSEKLHSCFVADELVEKLNKEIEAISIRTATMFVDTLADETSRALETLLRDGKLWTKG